MTSTVAPLFGHRKTSREWRGLTLSLTMHEPQEIAPDHYHVRPFFGLVLDGAYEETYSTRVQALLTPLSVAFVPAGEEHRGQAGDQGTLVFNLELDEAWQHRIDEVAVRPRLFHGRPGSQPTLLGMRLFREFKSWESSSPLIVEGLVLELLGTMAQLTQTARIKRPEWVHRALDMINDRFRESLAVQDVASEVGVHPVHLSRVFRHEFHLSVGEYIQRVRTEQACRALALGSSDLSRVAVETGFFDQSHLTRTLRRLLGVTPGQFRRAFQS